MDLGTDGLNDSPLEEAVTSELVSEGQFPCQLGKCREVP
jgi:hypothetical protein